MWQKPDLIADESIDYDVSANTAQRFLASVALRLGLSPAFVFAAYEDAFYYLWRERRLPSNVDPFESRLEDAGERERIARMFEQGLDAPVGHILPVARDVERHALADGAVVPAPGALLSRSGRFAARAIGCRSTPCRGLRRAIIRTSTRRIPRRRFPPLAPSHGDSPSASGLRRRAGSRACRARAVGARKRPMREAAASATRVPQAARVCGLDHAHGDVRGAARRRALRLHAARGIVWRTTSSWLRRWRPHPKRCRCP